MNNEKLTTFEKGWLAIFTIAITLATLYFSIGSQQILLDWIISPISAITGIFCVVMAAKGKISTFYWGIVNTALFAYLSFVAGFLGDAVMFGFFLVPMQFIGIKTWRGRLQRDSTEDVRMKRLTTKHRILIFGLILITSSIFAIFLNAADGFLAYFQANSDVYANLYERFGIVLLGPFLDAFSVVAQITGQFLMLYALEEQWDIWIFINIKNLFLWLFAFILVGELQAWMIVTLVMHVGYFGNSIYGKINWHRGVKHAKIM